MEKRLKIVIASVSGFVALFISQRTNAMMDYMPGLYNPFTDSIKSIYIRKNNHFFLQQCHSSYCYYFSNNPNCFVSPQN